MASQHGAGGGAGGGNEGASAGGVDALKEQWETVLQMALEWEHTTSVAGAMGFLLAAALVALLLSRRRRRPQQPTSVPQRPSGSVRDQRLQALRSKQREESEPSSERSPEATQESVSQAGDQDTSQLEQRNIKATARKSPGAARRRRFKAAQANTTGAAAHQATTSPSPRKQDAATRAAVKAAAAEKRRLRILSELLDAPVEDEANAVAVYKRRVAKHRQPLVYALHVFTRTERMGDAIDGDSAVPARLKEEAADDVRVEIMQSVSSDSEDLPAWARGAGLAEADASSSVSGDARSHASVWDLLLDECTGENGSPTAVAQLLAPLDETSRTRALVSLLRAGLQPACGLPNARHWDANMLDLCRLSLLKVATVLRPPLHADLGPALPSSTPHHASLAGSASAVPSAIGGGTGNSNSCSGSGGGGGGEVVRLLSGVLCASALHPSAERLASKAADVALAGLKTGPRAEDVLRPIRTLVAAAVDMVSGAAAGVARCRGDGFLFRDHVIALLTYLHAAHQHRLRYTDHTLHNDASFQRRLTSSHGPAIAAAHIALRLVQPILRSPDRAHLVNVRYVDTYMRRVLSPALLPPFVLRPGGGGVEGDTHQDAQNSESSGAHRGDSEDDEAGATGTRNGGNDDAGGEDEVGDQASDDADPGKQTYATKLVAACLSSLYVALPASFHAYHHTATALEMRIREARTTQTEREVLRARLTRHRIAWHEQMLAGNFTEELVTGCLLSLLRFCDEDAIKRGGAGVEIMSRISAQAIEFATGHSPQTVLNGVRSLTAEDRDKFAAWAVALLDRGMDFPIMAGNLAKLLHALLIDVRVPYSPTTNANAFISQTTGTVFIHHPTMEARLLPALMATFHGLDVIVGLDVDQEAFDKYAVKAQLVKLMYVLVSIPAHKSALDKASTQLLDEFCTSFLQSYLFALDSNVTLLRQVHFAEERVRDPATSSVDRTRARYLIEDNAARVLSAMTPLLLYMDLLALLLRVSSVAAAITRRQPLSFLASALTLISSRFSKRRMQELSVQHTSALSFDTDAVAISVLGSVLRLPLDARDRLAAAVVEDDEFTVSDLQSVVDRLQTRATQTIDLAAVEEFVASLTIAKAVREQQEEEEEGKEAATVPAQASASSHRVGAASVSISPQDLSREEEEYVEALSPLTFSTTELTLEDGTMDHFFATRATAPAPRAARALMKEFKHLRANLPVHPDASIFVRVDESNTTLVKTLLSGPPNTPYAYALFLFDIFLPPQYPQEPPQVRFLTNGRGRIRMNPNLYNNGTVCLSLLNTWHAASQREKWSASANLYQVLMALQTHMFVAKQMYNEPAQVSQNTQEDEERAELDDERVLEGTLRYGILDMLHHPPTGFEAVVDAHFQHCKQHLLRQIGFWRTQRFRLSVIPDLLQQVEAKLSTM